MLDPLISAARVDARRRHALWDAAAFDSLCAQARAGLEALDPATCRAWLRLATEPLASSTLRGCLARPGDLLTPIPAAARPAVLADLFNLCDGLSGAEPWFDPFIASRLDGLADLSDLPTLVELALEEVLSPAPTAWGEIEQFTLDPRPIDPLFVPGALTLAAPRVLCVQDRRRDTCLGVAFGSDLVTLFGPIPALPAIDPPAALVQVEDYRAVFGETTRYFGDLYPAHTHFVLGSALLAASVDSQRIWVMRPR